MLEGGGRTISRHSTFPEARAEAAVHDRKRLRNRSALTRLAVVVACGLLLVPVLLEREIDNPAYPEARAFADRMEDAYRDIDAGLTDAEEFTSGADGFAGGVFPVDRGGVESDYNVLAGSHDGDCYVIRWVRFEVPFVARLLPRFECVPGGTTLNFSAGAYEAIAVNLSTGDPLNWHPVLPEEIVLAVWFLPLLVLLLAVMFHQSVLISVLFLRKDPTTRVPVERVEGTDS